jgi:hypothetical protein
VTYLSSLPLLGCLSCHIFINSNAVVQTNVLVRYDSSYTLALELIAESRT